MEEHAFGSIILLFNLPPKTTKPKIRLLVYYPSEDSSPPKEAIIFPPVSKQLKKIITTQDTQSTEKNLSTVFVWSFSVYSVVISKALFQEVLGPWSAECPENIPFDLIVPPIQLFEEIFYFLPFGGCGTRAWIDKTRKTGFPVVTPDHMLIGKRQGPDHRYFPAEHRLERHHGTDLAGITHVQKKCFNDVVPVVPQGQLVAPVFGSQFKKPFPPQPGAEKAGIFPVLLTMAQGTVISMLHTQGIPLFPAIRLKLFAESAVEPRIDVKGSQLVLYRDPLQPFAENVHQKEAVGAAGEAHGNPVTIGYHRVPMDGLTNRPVHPLVNPAGMVLRHRRRLKSPKQRSHALFDLFLLIFCGDFARCDLPEGHNDIFIFR
jgi:hypothetical protein